MDSVDLDVLRKSAAWVEEGRRVLLATGDRRVRARFRVPRQ
jgi:hypothetical protein